MQLTRLAAGCDSWVATGNVTPGTAKGSAGRRLGQARTILNVTELTDEQLAQLAAREGSDGPAFVAILERFRQRVWSVCYRLMGNEHDASDAAQEVFVRLFVNRGKFEGRSKYSTWVHGIAVRTCLGIRRGRGRRQKHERVVGDEGSAPEAVARPSAPPGLSLDLMAILETLEEDDRALLILKYGEGYSHEELAAIFEISVSACKMRISRAREKIQKQFQDHGD
jgi:RNA polymerase sigma-70 factor, ECF subfamily